MHFTGRANTHAHAMGRFLPPDRWRLKTRRGKICTLSYTGMSNVLPLNPEDPDESEVLYHDVTAARLVSDTVTTNRLEAFQVRARYVNTERLSRVREDSVVETAELVATGPVVLGSSDPPLYPDERTITITGDTITVSGRDEMSTLGVHVPMQTTRSITADTIRDHAGAIYVKTFGTDDLVNLGNALVVQGNMSIGTAQITNAGDMHVPGAGERLYVDGNVFSTGDVVALSDSRTKTNVVTIPNALEKARAIRGVYYTKRDDPTGRRRVGVLAQEVESTCPEAVWKCGDGTKSVAYGNLVGLLFECIRELEAQIDDLRAQK